MIERTIYYAGTAPPNTKSASLYYRGQYESLAESIPKLYETWQCEDLGGEVSVYKITLENGFTYYESFSEEAIDEVVKSITMGGT